MKNIKFTIPLFLITKGGPRSIRNFIDIESIKRAGEIEAEKFKNNDLNEKKLMINFDILNIKVSLN